MSIKTQINRIKGNVSSAFQAVIAKGGIVTGEKSDNLAAAIGTISTMSGFYGFRIDTDGHLILTYDTQEIPRFAINSVGHLIHNYTGSAPPLSVDANGHLKYTIGE